MAEEDLHGSENSDSDDELPFSTSSETRLQKAKRSFLSKSGKTKKLLNRVRAYADLLDEPYSYATQLETLEIPADSDVDNSTDLRLIKKAQATLKGCKLMLKKMEPEILERIADQVRCSKSSTSQAD